MSPGKAVFLSIVVPVFNEAENLAPLLSELRATLNDFDFASEVILVNDGSDDKTESLLEAMAEEHPWLKVINLTRNYGQTAAMMAGFEAAAGEVIVPMDGDLQNDPADIPRLLRKIEEGYEVVSGWRKDRRDATLRRRIPSWLANRLISAIAGVRLHDYGCSLKAYRREAIEGVKLYGEMHRFIPIYANLQGARVAEMPVNHRPRTAGRSNYGLERITKVVLDLMVVQFLSNFEKKPIYLFGGFGLLNMLIAFAAGLYAVYLKVFHGTSFILTPLPLLTVMTFITGCMSILMGFLAEVAVRTYYESQGKSIYRVKNRINFDRD